MDKADHKTKPSSEHATREAGKRKQQRTNEILKKQGSAQSRKNFQELKYTNPTAFNIQAEAAFIELVRTLIEENRGQGIPIWEVYREAAYELKVSTETAKRYLLKHSARRAEFFVFGKMVNLNPRYVPEEEPEGEEADDEAEE